MLFRRRLRPARRDLPADALRREYSESPAISGSAKERLSAAPAGAPATDALDADSPYISVDPVPAAPASISVAQLLPRPSTSLRTCGIDTPRCLRFAIADPRRTTPATLGEVLTTSASALLKHEVCYVLGQIQEGGEARVDALRATLEDPGEHPMVRHEAAEAIGSIAAPVFEPLLLIQRGRGCIVAESCEVALDIMESAEINGEFVPLAVEATA